MNYSQNKMTIHAHAFGEHFIYEGETIMSQPQQDRYKTLIGDGLSKITVGRDQSEKDYGNGGGVVVSVTLTCDQSEAIVSQAIILAHQIADYYTWYYHDQLKQQLIQKGVLKSS